MTVELRPGLKLRSAVDPTEVVVVKGRGPVDLRCGGHPMVTDPPAGDGGAPAPGLDGGTLVGKRYVADDEGALELLCVRAGTGSLSMGDDVLHVKEPKPLPASD